MTWINHPNVCLETLTDYGERNNRSNLAQYSCTRPVSIHWHWEQNFTKWKIKMRELNGLLNIDFVFNRFVHHQQAKESRELSFCHNSLPPTGERMVTWIFLFKRKFLMPKGIVSYQHVFLTVWILPRTQLSTAFSGWMSQSLSMLRIRYICKRG